MSTGADGTERDKPVKRRPATERAMRRRNRREQHEGKGRGTAKDTDGTGRTGTARTPRTGTARTGAAGSAAKDGVVRDRASRGRGTRDRAAGSRPSARDGSTNRPGRSDRVRRPRTSTRLEPPTRRTVLVRRWVALSVAVGLALIVVVLLFTPLLGVRTVDVSGNQGLTADQVRAAAAVPDGTSMLRLDTAGIMDRVAQLPRVASVDVTREWPSSIRITVTERDPIGVVVESDGAHLVDGSGLDYATVHVAPAGLPKIQLTAIKPDDPRTLAVVRVLTALPAQLRASVIAVSAKTPGSVTLAITGGRTIRWGSADDSAHKSAVLAALMTRPGTVYDVSSPDLPTISGPAKS